MLDNFVIENNAENNARRPPDRHLCIYHVRMCFTFRQIHAFYQLFGAFSLIRFVYSGYFFALFHVL